MATDAGHGVRPREQAPELELPLVDGDRFRLADRKPERRP